MKDTAQLLEQLNRIASTLRRHVVILAIISFALLCSYILLLTMRLSAANPSAADVKEQANSAPRPRVDPSTVDTIMGLRDQNVQVRAIFNEARDNPFTE